MMDSRTTHPMLPCARIRAHTMHARPLRLRVGCPLRDPSCVTSACTFICLGWVISSSTMVAQRAVLARSRTKCCCCCSEHVNVNAATCYVLHATACVPLCFPLVFLCGVLAVGGGGAGEAQGRGIDRHSRKLELL